MAKKIWFDMDGTITDLYGVEGWLDMLRAENAEPYRKARPLVNMQALARVLNRLAREGYEINIISWTAKYGKPAYNEATAAAKREWLAKHLASVNFDYITIVSYGTPKSIVMNTEDDILFDDEEQNRDAWLGQAFEPEMMVKVLKALLGMGW
jgi:hypothetical protein